MTGARFGVWVLGGEIGRGPVGTVYRAVALDGRPAAVKVLTHPATRGPDFLQRFPSEMLPLQRLSHPNIARFYESGVSGGAAFYATELVEGADLATLLKSRAMTAQQPGLSWNEDLVRVAVQAARALKHGHHRSVLHRGLKPSNVLLAADGTVKLADFGVAKVLNLPPLGLDPDPWGTAGFLAPEHFTGKPLTRRSDLYSLGAALWALLAGRPPFTAATAAEFLHKHCYTLPDRPANFVSKLPAELDDLICSMLAKDPNRRPASAAAVLDFLDQIRGKLERKGVVWPADPGDTTGEEAALAEHGGQTAFDGGTPRDRPLMARPWVVLPLFTLVLAVFAYGLFRPRPAADDLWSAAQPLLASANPDDWDRAIDDYLDPLTSRYPDWHPADVKAARDRLYLRKELRRSIAQGARAKYGSEAERWYHIGLKLAQAGDRAGAERAWELSARAFDGVNSEALWAEMATAGIAELAALPPDTRPVRVGLSAAVERATAAGDTAALDALAALYRDDPEALATIRKGR